jgi:hypothetical protein
LNFETVAIRMPLNKDLREFVALLNSNEVEYLVVGAFAVAYYGYPRYTGDPDLLFRASEQNVQRILRVLTEFGFGGLGIIPEDLLSAGKVIQLGVSPNRIDLLNSISGVSFDDAWADRQAGKLDGITTCFIGRPALFRNKQSTGRSKDLRDADELRKRMADEA